VLRRSRFGVHPKARSRVEQLELLIGDIGRSQPKLKQSEARASDTLGSSPSSAVAGIGSHAIADHLPQEVITTSQNACVLLWRRKFSRIGATNARCSNMSLALQTRASYRANELPGLRDRSFKRPCTRCHRKRTARTSAVAHARIEVRRSSTAAPQAEIFARSASTSIVRPWLAGSARWRLCLRRLETPLLACARRLRVHADDSRFPCSIPGRQDQDRSLMGCVRDERRSDRRFRRSVLHYSPDASRASRALWTCHGFLHATVTRSTSLPDDPRRCSHFSSCVLASRKALPYEMIRR